MAIFDPSFDDFNSDIISNIEDLNCEDLEKESSGSRSFLDQPPCVPQDSVEDLEWYPNFTDDLISLTCLEFLNKPHEKTKTKNDVVLAPNMGYEDGEQPRQQTGSYVVLVYQDGATSFWKKPRKQSGVCRSAWLKLAADFKNVENVQGKKKCSHCMIEETPLWRNGPLGPRTLCNACGVRYKSGRLLAEYRPAASPTFDGRKHSNFHRRIIKKKMASN
ncbi:hypothetical protein L6164_008534 [Bauhinia variegata]|uniref:Uncharacterized protein n=1 Tax=Bauhinia variegata TaxID=167791 RepID=A0ACB9PH28_BAUVA|nr:hypothetical protein L6164_008534 [Bauhinia variegata]